MSDPVYVTKSPLDLEHERLVAALAKPGEQIEYSLTPEDCDLWHHATGIVTEAGELMDAVKKAVIYRKPLDVANVIEELGDLEFYLQGLRANLCIERDETLLRNVTKLRKRYGEKYSNEAAQARADKPAGE